VKNRNELISIIQSELLENSSEYWLNQCEVHGVPAGPINTIDQVMNDSQIKAREMIVTLDHPNSDQLEVVGNPIKFSRTPIQYKSAPPTLGEHTESVLERLDNLNMAK
jgi:crotonobetainyl-CoA:carnitine CoA-transferase CaiB-like acyl-CoA transferase